MAGNLVLVIIALSLVAYFVGQAQGRKFVLAGPDATVHSRPIYHGAFVAIWVGVPALVLVVLWLGLQGAVVERLVLASLPDTLTDGASPAQLQLILSEIKNAAAGLAFGQPSQEILAAAERYAAWRDIARWAMVAVAASLAIGALFLARARLAPSFRARQGFERFISIGMIVSSIVAILTTVGIIGALVYESWLFFQLVPITEFLFGLNWEPQIAIRPDQVAGAGAFGAVPVFVGTILIATIAMAVAIPIGLFSAIYLTEFASRRVRSIVKPLMEILAGIPTVVYGFFAVLVVAPAVRAAGAAVGIPVAPNTALVAGGVMGIMIIPFISSMTDDALNAVPRSMRDGSLAMGATKGETITKVLLPAALPGIAGGILLAVSRAIGETMIVLMAAGLIASLHFNPLDSVTTITVQIVTLLIGDTAFDNPKTLAAFGLGLTLFVATLGLNVVALRIVQKYREKYD
ncbi:MAG: phosphate ABC transporter permease subunit PstC [Microvirga sp.]|nr:phosphate ABC transporter permease subunit PstC [Microvirga sp.]